MNDPNQHSHPALNFSPMRAKMWDKFGTDEDFMRYIYGLATIYAKKHYKGNGKLDEDLLFKDFKKWRDQYMKDLVQDAFDKV